MGIYGPGIVSQCHVRRYLIQLTMTNPRFRTYRLLSFNVQNECDVVSDYMYRTNRSESKPQTRRRHQLIISTLNHNRSSLRQPMLHSQRGYYVGCSREVSEEKRRLRCQDQWEEKGTKLKGAKVSRLVKMTSWGLPV